MSSKRTKVIIWCVIVAVLAAILIILLLQNTKVQLNTITVAEENLPERFDGFRIAQISDFHSAQFGENNEKLISVIRAAKPDIIVITGDFMGSRDRDTGVALSLASRIVEIAPCYYVTGNHEARLSSLLYTELLDGLSEVGVTLLKDTEVMLTRDNDSISLVGHFWGNTDSIGDLSEFDGYRILLSHQPEDMENYAAAGYDLVFTGHAHGGQFRLPFIGGLFAPEQGFFPKYDSGLYSVRETDMIVSRGIGDSVRFVPRLNNPPEVVLAILECP